MRLRCPHCERTLEIPDSAAGKSIRCPACAQTTRAPEAEPADTSAPSAAPESRSSLYSSPPASSPLAADRRQPADDSAVAGDEAETEAEQATGGSGESAAASPFSEHAASPQADEVERVASAGGKPRVACPGCGKMLLSSRELANQIVACPHCHARLRMPSPADIARGQTAQIAFGTGTVADASAASSAPPQSTGDWQGSNPYSSPVGLAPGQLALPRSRGHSEPIVYILPGVFQLVVAASLFLGSLVGMAGMLIEGVDQGFNNAGFATNLTIMSANLLATGLVIVGSIQMIRRRSLGLARAASIVAIIPCVTCCFVLTPFGIWSTVVLFLPNAANDFI